MGSDRHYREEAPAHRVYVDGFLMDVSCVTNREFTHFVQETGYLTFAERSADPEKYPGVSAEMLAPSSTVFVRPTGKVDIRNHYNWWFYLQGANWKHPQGPDSNIDDLLDHPVVHIAYEDAEAYAKWAGKTLPTEAEWEFAARGGLDSAEFVWGDEFTPGGKQMANTWQGRFPYHNTLDDGFEFTSPVGSYPANGYGLNDMAGNVWQWTSDWFQQHGQINSPCCTSSNPRGGSLEGSYDPHEAASTVPRKVTKGGSHLCAPNYCQRYRPAARIAQPIDTSISHLGFRCVIR